MAVLSHLRMAAPPVKRLLTRSRAYGSVAAAQVQYDDYYDYEEQNQGREWNPTMKDTEGSESRRGVQWVIIGDPMAKRQVYAERLSELLDVPHISMGTLVRQELHPHSCLYKQIANAVNHGKLVPEDVIFGLLSKRLEEGYYKGETGFILDGIPRTRIQAEILDEIADIDLVVNLKCAEEHWVKSQLRNGIYSSSQEFLNMGSSGVNLSLQLKDSRTKSVNAHAEGAWKEKLHMYAEQCKPLEDYYRKQRKLINFQVAGAPGETWQGLLAALQLQHMSAVNSSQKLTV